MNPVAARHPIARTRYAFGQTPQPVMQPVAPAAEGFSMPIDRLTATNRANSGLIRELLGHDPDALDDVDWENMRSMLALLGLDSESVAYRAEAMTFRSGEQLNEAQVELAGLEPDTVARRRELLDRLNKPDPAIKLRDALIAEERRRRAQQGTITETTPTDMPASAQPTRTAPIAAPPVQPVAAQAERVSAASPAFQDRPHQDDKAVDAEGSSASTDEPYLSENDQRALTALAMLRSGAARKDIAEHFGKDASTIWRWLRRAETITRDKLNAVRPTDVLADFEDTFQAKRANLETEYAKACEAGSVRKMVELSREVRRWHIARFDVLHRSGLFRNYAHPAVMASHQDAERQSLRAMK